MCGTRALVVLVVLAAQTSAMTSHVGPLQAQDRELQDGSFMTSHVRPLQAQDRELQDMTSHVRPLQAQDRELQDMTSHVRPLQAQDRELQDMSSHVRPLQAQDRELQDMTPHVRPLQTQDRELQLQAQARNMDGSYVSPIMSYADMLQQAQARGLLDGLLGGGGGGGLLGGLLGGGGGGGLLGGLLGGGGGRGCMARSNAAQAGEPEGRSAMRSRAGPLPQALVTGLQGGSSETSYAMRLRDAQARGLLDGLLGGLLGGGGGGGGGGLLGGSGGECMVQGGTCQGSDGKTCCPTLACINLSLLGLSLCL